MNNLLNQTISAGQASGAVRNQAVAHASGRFTRFWQRLTARFQEAADAYRFEYHRVKNERIAVAPEAIPLRVAALLIGETHREIVPLSEGANFLSVTPWGLSRTKRPESPYEKPELLISVVADRLVKEEREQAIHRHLTNDRLMLGNRSYVVKVLPEEYRQEQRIKGVVHD